MLDQKQYVRELHAKLMEEAAELTRAMDDPVVEELADVLDVVHAIARVNGIGMDEVMELATRKRADRGGFDERWYLNSW
jgi:predicted house-cleaning noncanonical NTP pyrophosphatase (MazG superfamily)